MTTTPETTDQLEIPDPDQLLQTERQHKTERAERLRTIRENKKTYSPQEPQPMEPKNPHQLETPPHLVNEKANENKNRGVTIPQMLGSRPAPGAQLKEEGSVIVAKELAGQLGTDPEMKGMMRTDERKLGVFEDATLAALTHFSYRYSYDGIRYWGHIAEWWLTGSQGINGLGRRHILQALANTSGIQTVERAEKPNAVARNLWDRGWKKQAESEGKVVDQ